MPGKWISVDYMALLVAYGKEKVYGSIP